MANDDKRTGLWGKLARGLFEFDAPLTADLLPLLPDPATWGRRKLRRPPPGAPAGAVAEVETLEIDVQEDAPSEAVDGERAALVVVHGHAPGERFDLRCRDLDGAHIDELHRLHRYDGLTGLHHERYLRHRLRSEVSHARRHASPLALVLLDLAPRTAHGAALTGLAHDLMLREVARAVRRMTRDDEILGHHGPRQLALVLPGHDLQAATTRAEALRDAVAAAPLAIDGQRVMIEPRIGLAMLARDTLIHDDLLRAALAALPAPA